MTWCPPQPNIYLKRQHCLFERFYPVESTEGAGLVIDRDAGQGIPVREGRIPERQEAQPEHVDSVEAAFAGAHPCRSGAAEGLTAGCDRREDNHRWAGRRPVVFAPDGTPAIGRNWFWCVAVFLVCYCCTNTAREGTHATGLFAVLLCYPLGQTHQTKGRWLRAT